MIENILHTGFAGLVAVALVAAAASDVKSLTIPNWIPGAITLLFFVQAGLGWSLGLSSITGQFLPAIVVGTGTLIMFTLLFALNQMGGGDVKLIAATSLWAGPEYIFGFVIFTAIAGGLLAIVALLRGERGHKSTRSYAGLSSSVIAASGETPLAQIVSRPIPYGVAIAVGGLFVVSQLGSAWI